MRVVFKILLLTLPITYVLECMAWCFSSSLFCYLSCVYGFFLFILFYYLYFISNNFRRRCRRLPVIMLCVPLILRIHIFCLACTKCVLYDSRFVWLLLPLTFCFFMVFFFSLLLLASSIDDNMHTYTIRFSCI